MKKLYIIMLLFTSLSLGMVEAFSQNISINTTGAANSTSSMFEVIQPSAVNNTVGLFARHSGAATNAYAIWAEATGATNKYAIVVPSTGGSVGIGTITPAYKLETAGDIYANGGWFRVSGASGLYFESYGGGWHMTDATWIRSYNSKNVYISSFLRADGGIASGALATPGAGAITASGFINSNTSFQLAGVNVLFNSGTDVYGNIRVIQNNSTALQDGMYLNYNSTGGAAADLRLYANGTTERVRILASNGNVGIGSTAPAVKLHVVGNADATQFIVQGNATQSNTNPLIKLRNSAGTDLMSVHSDGITTTFVGLNAGRVNTGTNNSFMGSNAGYSNTSGANNTSVGYNAMYTNSGGGSNTAFGTSALEANTYGSANVAIGYQALSSQGNNGFNNGGVAWGSANTAVGYQALRNNNPTSTATGALNTAVGYGALASNTTGDSNTGLGTTALNQNTTAVENTGVGRSALGGLSGAVIGGANTAVGVYALINNTSGIRNAAVGKSALWQNTTGARNTGMGQWAGSLYFTATNSTFLGYSTDANFEGVTNSSVIGSLAVVNASNKVRIGATTVTVIEGQVAYTFPSDGRFKFNVKEDVKGLEFISKLRPVTYQFDTKKFEDFLIKDMPDSIQRRRREFSPDYGPSTAITHTGFIAQEVEKAAKESNFTFDGVNIPKDGNGNYGVAYSQFVVPLVKSVQELNELNQAQQKTIDLLLKRIEALENSKNTPK